MNRFFSILFFLISVSCLADNQKEDKCNVKKYLGEWYGEMIHFDGSSRLMYMNIQEAAGCEIRGEFHWPAFLNVRTKFVGKAEGNIIHIDEVDLLQGVYMDLENGHYTISLINDDVIEGSSFYNDERSSTFKISRKSSLSNEQLSDFHKKLESYQSNYGTVLIQEESEIDPAELYAKYLKVSNKAKIDAPMIAKGKLDMGTISMPMTVMYKPTRKFYLEMKFQDVAFKMGSNETETWNYDPINDNVTIEVPDTTDSNNNNQFSNKLISTMEDGYDMVQVNESKVDSISCYRILTKKDELVRVFYLDRESYQVVRQEIDQEVNLFFNYIQIEGLWMPTTFFILNPFSDIQKFRFESVEIVENIDDSVFEMPDELRAKVKDSKKEKEAFQEIAQKASESFENGDYKLAASLYSDALKGDPYNDEYYYQRGRCRYYLEDNYAAISDMEEAISLNSNVSEYYNIRGLIKFRLRDYPNAIKDYKIGVEVNEDNAVIYLNMAYAYYYSDEVDSAIHNLKVCIEKDSTRGQCYGDLGWILSEQERYSEAIPYLKKSIALNYGDEGELENKIGVAYYALQEFDKAEEYFKKAVKKYPENDVMLANLGKTYYHLEDYKTAIKTLEKSEKINSENDDALNFLGLAHYQVGEYDMSVNYFGAAIQMSPKNALYYDNRAYSLMKIMKYQEAIADFTRSIELYPDDPEVYYQRGILHSIQNNRFDACLDFKKSADMEHEEAREVLNEECKF